MTIQTEEYRTSIVFSLKDKIGALIDALQPFKKYNINLTRITSRPHTKKEWRYVFFIEILGKQQDTKVKKALSELEKHTVNIYILGSYPLKKV